MSLARSCAVAAVASFALAVACGGLSVETSCASLFDRQVAHFQRCGGFVDPTQKSAYVDACVEASTAPGTNDLVSQLDACSLDSCDGRTCILRGTLAANAPCGTGWQCQSGFCKPGTPSPDSELVCGTCEAVGAAGADCSASRCGDGLYCAAATTTCAPVIPQGGACDVSSSGCDVGLYCDPVAGKCLAPPTTGQPCTSLCASPSLCLGSGVCVDPVGVGAPCPVGDECDPNLVCDAQTKQCAPMPVSNAGGPCQPDAIAVCDAGLICVASVCTPPKPQGAPCTVGGGECAVDLFCVGGTCQPPDYGSCK